MRYFNQKRGAVKSYVYYSTTDLNKEVRKRKKNSKSPLELEKSTIILAEYHETDKKEYSFIFLN